MADIRLTHTGNGDKAKYDELVEGGIFTFSVETDQGPARFHFSMTSASFRPPEYRINYRLTNISLEG